MTPPEENSKEKAIFVRTVLHRLGAGKLDTFDERIRTQKIQYFAQVFNVLPKYKFNLYLRGPYSPELTRDLYPIEDVQDGSYEFASEVMQQRFEKLKSFVEGKTIKELELIATYHWLIKELNMPQSDADSRLTELKRATANDISFVKEALAEIP